MTIAVILKHRTQKLRFIINLTSSPRKRGSIFSFVLDPHLRGDVGMDSRLHGNDVISNYSHPVRQPANQDLHVHIQFMISCKF